MLSWRPGLCPYVISLYGGLSEWAVTVLCDVISGLTCHDVISSLCSTRVREALNYLNHAYKDNAMLLRRGEKRGMEQSLIAFYRRRCLKVSATDDTDAHFESLKRFWT